MSDPSLQQARDADFDERRSAMLQWKKDCEDRVLSLRDQFAAAALTGLLCGTRDVQPFHESAYAELAYRCADAMLAARSATYFKKMADEMDAAGVLPVAPPPSAEREDQEHRMSDETTPQDDAAMSPASAGSVAIGAAQSTGYDEWYCPWYLCPKCEKNHIARSFSYCPNCGVKLEWQPHARPEP